ncbi:hypothetical protein JCM8097_004880 [Rhodosporidiobolus ruineniae]
MGFAFLLAGGAVSWSSKLQPRVAASSTEAEYLGLSHASKEAVFLSQLLGELATIRGANALSRDPQFHDRTPHLRLTEHRAAGMVKVQRGSDGGGSGGGVGRGGPGRRRWQGKAR